MMKKRNLFDSFETKEILKKSHLICLKGGEEDKEEETKKSTAAGSDLSDSVK